MKYNTIFMLLFFLSMFLYDGLLFSYDSTLNTYGAKHKIEYRGMDGEAITIEDGSVWTVHPRYHNQVSLWEEGSDIWIQHNVVFEFWSGFKCVYEVVHIQSGQKATVEIFSEPNLENPYRRTITKIETIQPSSKYAHYLGLLYLSDGTIWKTNSYDYFPGDSIIVVRLREGYKGYGFLNPENGNLRQVFAPSRSRLEKD